MKNGWMVVLLVYLGGFASAEHQDGVCNAAPLWTDSSGRYEANSCAGYAALPECAPETFGPNADECPASLRGTPLNPNFDTSRCDDDTCLRDRRFSDANYADIFSWSASSGLFPISYESPDRDYWSVHFGSGLNTQGNLICNPGDGAASQPQRPAGCGRMLYADVWFYPYRFIPGRKSMTMDGLVERRSSAAIVPTDVNKLCESLVHGTCTVTAEIIVVGHAPSRTYLSIGDKLGRFVRIALARDTTTEAATFDGQTFDGPPYGGKPAPINLTLESSLEPGVLAAQAWQQKHILLTGSNRVTMTTVELRSVDGKVSAFITGRWNTDCEDPQAEIDPDVNCCQWSPCEFGPEGQLFRPDEQCGADGFIPRDNCSSFVVQQLYHYEDRTVEVLRDLDIGQAPTSGAACDTMLDDPRDGLLIGDAPPHDTEASTSSGYRLYSYEVTYQAPSAASPTVLLSWDATESGIVPFLAPETTGLRLRNPPARDPCCGDPDPLPCGPTACDRAEEICDGLDNDCDGATDEGLSGGALTVPTTCGLGECSGSTGFLTCVDSVLVDDTCDPLQGAGIEICDGLDNDCDGESDDACGALQMEAGSVAVGGAHVTVPLVNTYFDPIVVATVQYANNTQPVITRVSNVTATSFDLRLQNPSGVAPEVDNVSYWVVERGVWMVDGVKLEADRYLSTRVDRKGAWLWGEPRTYGQVYAQPVVLGQVMSENDPRWSVFFAQGANHFDPPNASTLKTGRHIGEDTAHARANETIGYIVVEAVHTNLAGVELEAAQGLDTVLGVQNGAPFSYNFNNPFVTAPTVVLASSAGMDGGDGGWAQVHGPTMATTTRLNLSIDEDKVGDAERSHTSEQVTYAAFSGPMIFPVPPMCVSEVDCDDGAFCNGAEQCDGNQVCRPGDDPCPGQLCDEDADTCIEGVTAKMESVSIPAGSTSASLVNSYASPVIACTPVYDANNVPVVVRVTGVTGDSFSVSLQNPGDLDPVDPDPINCLVVEEGSWMMDGHPVEAHKYTSVTTDKERNWLGVAQSLTHGFANPVVLGQVMSTNDTRWSVYWQRGTAQNQPPSASALRNGKTVCEDPDGVRADETIGFIVFEQSNGMIAGVSFEAALGPDTVAGVDNAAPFDYTFNVPFGSPPAFAVATQAGMDGSDGSWAYLYGSSYATATQLSLAVDEDQIFNAERGHTTEQVGYVAFETAVVFPETGCEVDADCDDGNFCNGDETCFVGRPMGGSICQAGTPIVCDDGVDCTDDVCNEATDVCSFTANDANCDNDLFCDGVETCSDTLGCQAGVAVDCGMSTCDEFSDTCPGDGPVARIEWGFVENVGGLVTKSGSTDKVPAIGTRVYLENNYVDPVVVVSIRYANNTLPVVARLAQVAGHRFDVYLQNPSGQPVLPETVDYIVVEKGTWVIDGVAIEAQKYLSTETAHDGNWSRFDVRAYGQPYTHPVVLGQVMSNNDANFSTFWSRGPGRSAPPTATALNTGKMVGEDPNTVRADETIGFIVIEAGHGFLGGVEYEAGVSTDSVAGVVGSPPYTDTFTTSFPGPPGVTVATQTAMDGFNGGWMYTLGAMPASATVLNLAGDEDQLQDAERSRATEQAAYIVFQTASPSPAP